jgi:acetolactate synthase-1/2/3 large subunit
VPYAFGLCGHGNIGFIDALYERARDIKTISTRHETVSGFMADVYYRVTGQPTATFTSCGPGSVNLPIALANAYLDSVPFLAVTGNVPTTQFNRGAFQELYRRYQADYPSTVRAICKQVFQPTRGEQVPQTIRQAWKTMVTGRPGPVVVDVPFDIFKEEAGETPDPRNWSAGISCRCGADPEGVAKAAEMLIAAERPTILVGQGVRYGGASEDLLRLTERLQIPVAASASGLGALDTHHPLSLGLVSRGRALSGQFRDAAGRRAARTRRALRRPHLVVMAARLFVHNPPDQADPCRYRSRRDRPQLSGRAGADGRCAHVSAPATRRDRAAKGAAHNPGAAGLA